LSISSNCSAIYFTKCSLASIGISIFAFVNISKKKEEKILNLNYIFGHTKIQKRPRKKKLFDSNTKITKKIKKKPEKGKNTQNIP